MKWLKRNIKNILAFGGPVIFEITNQVTGSWVNSEGKLSIGIGKFVTILVGVAYFSILSYFTYKEQKRDTDIKKLEDRINYLEKKSKTYQDNEKALREIFGYTTEKIRNQVDSYRKTQCIDSSFINSTNAATIVCDKIYNAIMGIVDEECRVTVNYYIKYSVNRKTYTEMIGHEGYNTNPQFYKIPKLLKIDKDSYYCERLLNDSNPAAVFLENKEKVRKAFKINGAECKYNQYAGIPIRRLGSSEKVALIEIVAHNDSIIWNTQDEASEFISQYCDTFKEYMLLIDMLSKFNETINEYQNGRNGGIKYAENCTDSR